MYVDIDLAESSEVRIYKSEKNRMIQIGRNSYERKKRIY